MAIIDSVGRRFGYYPLYVVYERGFVKKRGQWDRRERFMPVALSGMRSAVEPVYRELLEDDRSAMIHKEWHKSLPALQERAAVLRGMIRRGTMTSDPRDRRG